MGHLCPGPWGSTLAFIFQSRACDFMVRKRNKDAIPKYSKIRVTWDKPGIKVHLMAPKLSRTKSGAVKRFSRLPVTLDAFCFPFPKNNLPTVTKNMLGRQTQSFLSIFRHSEGLLPS